jgi:putative membrane protein insertion efficiency factor
MTYGIDTRTGPGRAVGSLLRLMVRAYQVLLSPVLPPACRYLPTCSDYALEAIAVHGPWRGAGLAAWRLAHCHPWGGSGYDPVPPPRSQTKAAIPADAGARP